MIWFWPCGSALEWSARVAQRSVFAAAGAAAKTSISRQGKTRGIATDVRRSVDLRARLLHDLGTLVLLRADEGAELRGRLRAQLGADLVEALLQRGRAEDLRDRGVDLANAIGRRVRRRNEALERSRRKPGQDRGLRDRRYVGHRGK